MNVRIIKLQIIKINRCCNLRCRLSWDGQLDVAVKLQWRGDSGECILIFNNDMLWSARFSWTGSCGWGEGTEIFGQQQDCVLYDGSGRGREATNRPGRGFKTKVSIRSNVIQSKSVYNVTFHKSGPNVIHSRSVLGKMSYLVHSRSVWGQISYNEG